MNASVEDLFKRNESERLLDDLLAECANKLEAGEAIDVESLVHKHPERAEELRRLLPAIQVLAGLERVAEVGADLEVRGSDEKALGALGDFRLLRQIGRGGMGVVYEAIQISLSRRVALKVLPFAATMDRRHLQRFQNEARAAASLEHPHIVPVYGVGCERGMHYYAMKFIDGQSLAELIEKQRAPSASELTSAPRVMDTSDFEALTQPPSPETAVSARTERAPPDAPAFRQIAQWGIQAAQALEHAHAFGIIHRDIKPGNLLIEDSPSAERSSLKLWVTDFGLARTAADAGLTMSGDLIGTLRYMSPEQALAKRIADHRTDVYSLGATLYELLTLGPAYAGNDRQELLRQIAFEEPRPLRTLNPAIPPELETIVLKAMEKNPDDRFATAQEMAEDLERYLKDEPIRAKRPTLLQRLRKWARRHRGVVLTTAIIAPLFALMLGVGLWWQVQARVKSENLVRAAIQEVMRLEEEAKWPQALAAARQAEALTAHVEGSAAQRHQVRDLLTDLRFVAQLDEIRLGKITLDGDLAAYRQADPAYATAFRAYGIDVESVDPALAGERIRASPIRDPLVAALDDWAWIKPKTNAAERSRLWTIAQLADPDDWRNRFRDPEVCRDRQALEELAESPQIDDLPVSTILLLGRALSESGSGSKAQQVLARAHRLNPGDFWLNFAIGRLLLWQIVPSRPLEALGYIRAALAIRPQSPVLHVGLGNALVKIPESIDEAMAAYRRAIELKPDFADAYNALGAAFGRKGNWQEAAPLFRQSIRLDPKAANVHANLGTAYMNTGDRDKALAALSEAVRLRPNNPEFQCEHAALLVLTGDTVKYQRLCAWMLARFGETQDPRTAYLVARMCGLAPEAVADLGRPVALAERANAGDPGTSWYLHTLATAHYRAGNFDQAVECLHESLKVDPQWSAMVCNWLVLAMAHQRLGHVDEARHWLDKARMWMRQTDPDVSWWESSRPVLHPHDWLACQLFLREAAELLGAAESSVP